jgi:hypothetical protein
MPTAEIIGTRYAGGIGCGEQNSMENIAVSQNNGNGTGETDNNCTSGNIRYAFPKL